MPDRWTTEEWLSKTISLIILTSRSFAFFGTQIGVRVVLLVTIVLAPNHPPFSNPWAFTHQGNDPFLRQLGSKSPRLNRFVSDSRYGPVLPVTEVAERPLVLPYVVLTPGVCE